MYNEGLFFEIFILLVLAALGLYCRVQAFSNCCEQGLLFCLRCLGFSLQGLLQALLQAEHRLQGTWGQ